MVESKVKVETPKKVKPEIKIPEKHHYFPKLLFLFGLILVVYTLLNFFNLFSLNQRIVDLAILLAGLWMMKLAIAKGLYKKRKEIFKKYI
ncbi:MAG: hypothetical protein KKH52_02810 [Nanoarchaeota archaeon]|nr:hypothetical protein [Nanoarchaeota archaeon]MBU1622417.1 hypothetical protein [Nanoarchaeota archaeon]MBU1974301.1 hypothetical protein [Nanoarchaeota archaeon]